MSNWDRTLNPFRYDKNGDLTESAKQRDAEMTLDHVAPESGVSTGQAGPVLKVTPSVLRERAGKAEIVAADFEKADDSAMGQGSATAGNTGQIAAGLRGFHCAGAFASFQERWGHQMRYVKTTLLRDVAGGLRAAANDHQDADTDVAKKLKKK
ncbi:type VII secretion target [Streptomyces sp. RKAG337]|uniref:type VII secretion target n=1 Tax=Streptomyces sp. RKAG337 TaxID=2893404 RepID=UPI002033F236|nr:type VII secretion target [Streptomyces sp. RKAG337]MCM2425790.1 hypothetical protein [Streptomyces sp. RKAG337]